MGTDDRAWSVPDVCSHCASAHKESLFGSMDSLNITSGSTSILIIVFFVFLIEKIFHMSHKLARETPFYSIVAAIEKEMMIVGCVAFFFKVIVNLSHFLDKEWLHSLEYAGEEQ